MDQNEYIQKLIKCIDGISSSIPLVALIQAGNMFQKEFDRWIVHTTLRSRNR